MKFKQVNLGRVVLSASGLRKMANHLRKKYKTDEDIELDCYMSHYGKYKTIGYIVESGKVIKGKI